jgi:hypothetical protein
MRTGGGTEEVEVDRGLKKITLVSLVAAPLTPGLAMDLELVFLTGFFGVLRVVNKGGFHGFS